MTIFDVLRDIFQNKTGKCCEKVDFDSSLLSNYIFQRWVSMSSLGDALLTSEITNKLYNGLDDDKRMWYKLFTVLLEKRKFGNCNYIKRAVKQKDDSHDAAVTYFSELYGISKREVANYCEFFDIKLEKEFKKLSKG